LGIQIAAIMMVRNEAAIIADSVGHLLNNIGVDRLYVADNGSTDRTYALLRSMAGHDPRSTPGPFHQPTIIRWMTEKAVEDGADCLLPNDADEFFWPDGAALRDLCAGTKGEAGFFLEVCNFVQLDWIKRDWPGSLETMLFSAKPHGAPHEGPARVLGGLPVVRACYMPELLLRATPDIHLQRGAHTATGLTGPLVAAPAGQLLHAPIRARDDLASRIKHALRVMELADDPATSWHLKRLVGMDSTALNAEWCAKSTQLRWPPPEGFRLRSLAEACVATGHLSGRRPARPLALRPRHRQTLDPHRRRVHSAA